MNLLWVLVIVLVVLALVGAPGGPWVHGGGWYPSGGIGLVVLILIVLILAGRL